MNDYLICILPKWENHFYTKCNFYFGWIGGFEGERSRNAGIGRSPSGAEGPKKKAPDLSEAFVPGAGLEPARL